MALEVSDLLLPGGWELLGALVVASEAVDPALHKDESELRVLVLPVPLQVLPYRHRLLDQKVEVLRDLWCQPMGLEDAKDLAPGDALDEGDAVLVTEQDADLRRHLALLRGLGD